MTPAMPFRRYASAATCSLSYAFRGTGEGAGYSSPAILIAGEGWGGGQ